MRSLHVTTLLALLCALTSCPARADNPDKKVTLNLKDVPLRNAITLLFQGSGLQYAIEPNVPSVPINLNIKDVGLQQALRIIIRQAAVSVPGLVFARDGDVFVVRIRHGEAGGPGADKPDEITLAGCYGQSSRFTTRMPAGWRPC